MRLDEALKYYRKSSHLLQKQIAGNIGVSTEYYNKIENGKVVPSWRVINRIVGLLGISVEFSDPVALKVSTTENRPESQGTHTGASKFRKERLTIAARMLHALFVAFSFS